MISNQIGLMAELKFQVLAISKGLKVSAPVSPASRYDFIIDNGDDLLKVQVKSTKSKKKRKNTLSYEAQLTGGDKVTKYTEKEVDIFCIYLEELDIWYVLPSKKVAGIQYINLFPNSEESKYDVYKDGWDLFYNLDN